MQTTPNTDDLQRYWDANAANFDALYDAPSPLHRAFNAVFRRALFIRVQKAADEIRKLGDATVLDVGCGSGRTAIPLALGGAKHVTGIDFAPQMIELAQKSARDAGVSEKTTFRVQDFLTEGSNERYDVVSAMGVLDYVDDPVPFVRRMLELARHRAVFSAPKPSLVRANLRKYRYGKHGVNVHFYTAKSLRRLCEDAGAKVTMVTPISAGFFVACTPAKS